MNRLAIGCCVAVLATATPVFAQSTLIVDDDGGGSIASCDDPAAAFATIGAAIGAAANGDTVLVCPGTYVENLDFAGKSIAVRSVAGPAVTVVDGNQADSVVTFASGEGPAAVLENLTLRNGRSGFDTPGSGDGGGIRIDSSSPTIRGNVIVGNTACVGIGISIRSGSPNVEANQITDNQQSGCLGGTGGGGIGIVGRSTAVIRANVIAGNVLTSADGGGIALFNAGTPLIERNVIVDNVVGGLFPCAEGGGINMVNTSDATIAGNIIARNRAGCGGGLAWLVPSGNRGPVVVNNTIVDNDSTEGSGIFADGFDAATLLVNNVIVAAPGQTAVFCGDFGDVNPPVFRFNDVFSPGGTAYGGVCADHTGTAGNISQDPLFVDRAGGDYHLSEGSPAVDAGDNSAPGMPSVDVDGDPRVIDGDSDGTAVVDIGADEVVPGAAVTSVAMDVMPGNAANVVNPRNRGVLLIAILSTDDFDATTVDAGTVRLGPAGGRPVRIWRRDANHDGRLDLVLELRTETLGIECGATTVTLVGSTAGGLAIEGEDRIRTAGCR